MLEPGLWCRESQGWWHVILFTSVARLLIACDKVCECLYLVSVRCVRIYIWCRSCRVDEPRGMCSSPILMSHVKGGETQGHTHMLSSISQTLQMSELLVSSWQERAASFNQHISLTFPTSPSPHKLTFTHSYPSSNFLPLFPFGPSWLTYSWGQTVPEPPVPSCDVCLCLHSIRHVRLILPIASGSCEIGPDSESSLVPGPFHNPLYQVTNTSQVMNHTDIYRTVGC